MDDADRHLLTLFSAALERESEEDRAAFLDGACAGAPGLRERVEDLLRAHDRPGHFLEPEQDGPTSSDARSAESPTATIDPPDVALAEPGETIGPYRLLQVIGEGGMGTVYLAEQSQPVRRRVALKVVRQGMDSRQVLARFGAERQALALMDHPNIARVLDAGATASGRPYFAMELVKGTPITKFCDERKLTPRERIELFVPVCQAVQHAHQKGVIHRDLKPSNVLVALYDDKPVPKVIDFGIAKAAGTKLAERTVFTEFGAIIGTLEYMSPEQAQLNQLDIDTRSDVYSLGVLLYELLTGTTPMDRGAIGRAALLEVLRLIREADTPRPSLRLSSVDGLPVIAAARGLEPKKLSGLVRGDLDWIVMRALEKDRSRRYESASAFARDLERHLHGEAVEACPPTAAYRLRKFARRHRVAIAVGATIAATMLIATSVSVWQAVRATRAERFAVEAAEVERQTTTFFIDDLLGNASLSAQVISGIAPDPDLRVRELVDRAAGRVEGRFADQPLVEAAVRKMIGRVYESLGLHEESRSHLERSYEIRRRALGETHRATLGTAGELGQAESRLALHDRGIARLRRTLDLTIRGFGEEDDLVGTTLGIIGHCLEAAGRHDEAAAMTRRALAKAEGRPGPRRLILRNNLAIILTNLGDEAGAEAILGEALVEALAAVGEDHPLVPLIRVNLALTQRLRGQFRRAEETSRKALEGSRKLFGERHPTTLTALHNLGGAQAGLGRLDEAETTLRAWLELARKTHGPESEVAYYATVALADVVRQRGRVPEAESLLVASLETARKLGPTAEAIAEGNLGLVDESLGRYPQAERRLRKAEAEYQRLPSPEKRFLLGLKRSLVVAIAHQGRHREAIDRCRDALRQAEAAFGPDDILTFHLLSDLVNELRIVGLDDEAEAIYPRLIALAVRLKGEQSHDALAVRQGYAALLHIRGRFEAAEAQYREGVESFARTLGPEHGSTLQIVSNLGELYRDWGRPDRAEPLLRRALEGQERVRGPGHPLTLWTLWKIAEMDRDLGRLDEAEAKFRRCLEGYAKSQGEGGLELAMIRADLALNHLKKREPDRAEPLLRQALLTYEAQLPDDWRKFEIQSQLGDAIALQGRRDEAEPLLLAGYDGLRARSDRITVDARARRPEAGTRIVRLYESWEKPDRAGAWREKLSNEGKPAPSPETAAARTPGR